MRRTILTPAVMACGLAVLVSSLLVSGVGPATATAAERVYPLRVSSNGHYLVDQRGRPFYVVAEGSSWPLPLWTREQAKTFIDDRASRGFNTIAMFTSAYNPFLENAYGQLPFALVDGIPDFTQPNPAYFERVDEILSYGASKGIQFYLGTANLGSCEMPCLAYKNWLTPWSATVLGEFLGQRYVGYDNIVWNLGGDTPIEEADFLTPIVEALVSGLQEFDTRHLATYHLSLVHSSSELYLHSSWHDFSSIQTYYPGEPAGYALPLADYGSIPAKPTIVIEPPYENNWDPGTPSAYDVRQATGWAALSGTFGVAYGAYPFWEPSLPSDWEASLDLPGVNQFTTMADLLRELEWYRLVPDADHALVTDGYGVFGSDNYATAALADDRSFGLVYVPSQRTITVSMAAFSGRVRASWFDPTSGSMVRIGTFANQGSQAFESPTAAHSDGQKDYLLLLEAPRSGRSD